MASIANLTQYHIAKGKARVDIGGARIVHSPEDPTPTAVTLQAGKEVSIVSTFPEPLSGMPTHAMVSFGSGKHDAGWVDFSLLILSKKK